MTEFHAVAGDCVGRLWSRIAVSPYNAGASGARSAPCIVRHIRSAMSALGNRAFVKMNGLGNEIVVVDMRQKPAAISAEEARAAAQPAGAPYDQMMALYPPRTVGTESFVRIYNSDGSEVGACGNGMRCVASLLSRETGRTTAAYETDAGVLQTWRDAG